MRSRRLTSTRKKASSASFLMSEGDRQEVAGGRADGEAHAVDDHLLAGRQAALLGEVGVDVALGGDVTEEDELRSGGDGTRDDRDGVVLVVLAVVADVDHLLRLSLEELAGTALDRSKCHDVFLLVFCV
jgi:hypothetical protein